MFNGKYAKYVLLLAMAINTLCKMFIYLMASSEVFILFVSSGFSEYCYNREIERRRGVKRERSEEGEGEGGEGGREREREGEDNEK